MDWPQIENEHLRQDASG